MIDKDERKRIDYFAGLILKTIWESKLQEMLPIDCVDGGQGWIECAVETAYALRGRIDAYSKAEAYAAENFEVTEST